MMIGLGLVLLMIGLAVAAVWIGAKARSGHA
jgi:hypothetical protein